MCRRTLPLILLLQSAFVGSLRAQDVETELERQVDSLAGLVEQSALEAEVARAAREAMARRLSVAQRALDTLRVGPLHIVALRSEGGLAGELFSEVWEEHYRGYDSPSVSAATFTFQTTLYEVESISVAENEYRVTVPRWSSRDQVKRRIQREIGQAISEDLLASPPDSWSSESVRMWSPSNPFLERDPARLYREMVLTPWRSVRRCLEGDTLACTTSLGLGTEIDLLEAWYTPEERRSLVAASNRSHYSRQALGVRPVAAGEYLGPEEVRRCMEAYEIDACDALLLFDLERWAPLPGHMRASLVGLALERGGEGAWTRLVEDPSMPAEEALARAAGVPLEELVAEWRDWIVTNRPEVYAGTAGKSALALLWIVLFATLATRSTRWRFS